MSTPPATPSPRSPCTSSAAAALPSLLSLSVTVIMHTLSSSRIFLIVENWIYIAEGSAYPFPASPVVSGMRLLSLSWLIPSSFTISTSAGTVR